MGLNDDWDAIERAERLSELLQEALAIAKHARPPGLLRLFIEARKLVRYSMVRHSPFRVDVLTGRFYAHGLPVEMTWYEFGLVAALSLAKDGVPRTALAKQLFPDYDETTAAHMIKLQVQRVRRRAGAADIVYFDGPRLRLSPAVDVELPRIAAVISGLRPETDQLPEAERWRLERIRLRLSEGRPEFMLAWEWFSDTERHLRDLTRTLTVFLAREALRFDHFERAIALADALIREDPLDEYSAEIVIRAFTLASSRVAAIFDLLRAHAE
jgi:DNA-binding SARP family transcriptional activator